MLKNSFNKTNSIFCKLCKIIFVLTVFSVILFSISCSKQTSELAELSDMGNSIGNLNNLGLIAQYDDRIYHMIWEDGKPYLVKSDFNGINRDIISQTDCLYLNIIDDWIYYINSEDSNKVYKMDIDGHNNQKLNEIKGNFLIAFEEGLYVISVSEKYNNSLYYMDYDGRNVKIICNDKVSSIFFYNNYIYYTSVIDSNGKVHLCRMDIDGSDKEIILDDNVKKFFIYKDNIFYLTGEIIQNRLCRTNINGKKKTVLEKNAVIPEITMNLHNNTLYYRDLSNLTFNQINLDTSKKKILDNISFTNIYIIDNKIFHYENDRLFCMDLDGSDNKPF